MVGFVEMLVGVIKGDVPTWDMVALWKHQAMELSREVAELKKVREYAEYASDAQIKARDNTIAMMQKQIDETGRRHVQEKIDAFHDGYERAKGQQIEIDARVLVDCEDSEPKKTDVDLHTVPAEDEHSDE